MILRKQQSKPRRGVSVVEAAFVLGVFVLFMFGILEYARYMYFMHIATNATATAARYAVAHTGDGTTSAQVQTIATNAMNGQQTMLGSSYAVTVFAAQPGVSPPAALGGTAWNDAAFGNGICVRITGTYQFLATTLLGINTVPINVSAVMTSEAN